MARLYLCPKCGKHTKKIIEGLCKGCHLTLNPLIIKDIKLQQCPNCGKFQVHNQWVATKIGDLLKKIIEEKGKISFKIPVHSPAAKTKVKFNVTLKGKQNIIIPAELAYVICPNCAKEHSTYFEAILQLRNPKSEIIDFINKALEKEKSKGVFLTKEEEVTNGIDYYITSKRFASKLGRLLKKKFKGELKLSPRLFTKDWLTSKDVYRLSVLFRASAS